MVVSYESCLILKSQDKNHILCISRAVLILLKSMENESDCNTYEDARKQRLLENKRRFEDLGLLKLSKSLSGLTKSEKTQNQHVRRKPTGTYLIEPRRSSRARNPAPSYRDDEVCCTPDCQGATTSLS